MKYELFVIGFISVLFFILVIKPLREMLVWFITEIIVPACKFTFNYLLLYGLKIIKNIIMSHAHILKNMMISRAVVFPKNEDMRQERDKAMNRKK